MRSATAIAILICGPCLSILASLYAAAALIALPIALRRIDEEAA